MALPPTKGGIDLLIWTIVFTIVDGLFVFLRFWAAHLIKRRIYADDYLIVFALVSAFKTPISTVEVDLILCLSRLTHLLLRAS